MPSQRWPRLVLLLPLAGFLLLGLPPRAAHAQDLQAGDFVVGVRRPDPLHPLEEYRRGGRILRVRGGASTTFCDSTPDQYTQGFFQTPHEVVLDGQGRVVFLAALGTDPFDGFALWRCDALGATPTLLGAFGGGSALGYPQPIGPQAVCHAVGLHMKRTQGLDLNQGTLSADELYVFAINTACGSGPYETIAYDPVSDHWIDTLEDPVPTMVSTAGNGNGNELDMINAGGITWSVGSSGYGGIRGVFEPLRITFQVSGVLSGGLVLGGLMDVIDDGYGNRVLWDDLTVPNVPTDCGPPVHFDNVPQAAPYGFIGGSKGPFSASKIAWRDGGLVVQGGPGRHQAPGINNFALFDLDPTNDVSSMAHDDISCQHHKTIQFTPWHAWNEFVGSNGISHDVDRMTPNGSFGTQMRDGRIISLGPGDAAIQAQGLEFPVGLDVYPPFVPSSAGVAVFFKIDSPMNVLITAPDGRRIGADLVTGAPVNDFGVAGYDSPTTQPRIYGLRDPGAGGFVIQARGTGAGPYSITTFGANLASEALDAEPFTGTAALGVESNHQFALDAAAGVTPLPATCSNGLDDDGDGKIDYQAGAGSRDFGCASATDFSERGTAPCDDGLDNDGDGGIDYRVAPALGDIGCSSHRSTIEAPQCQDGIDNDLATGIDFDGGASVNGGNPLAAPDPQCTAPTLGREAPATGGCGIGPELAGVFVLLAAARRWRREARID